MLRSCVLASTPRRQRGLEFGAAFALAAGVVCASCVPAGAPLVSEKLHPCASTEGPTDGYCGGLEVYENREAGSGRKIRLAIVVLPSVSSDVHGDPLVFLAGGPGQAAAQMASLVQPMFRKIQRTRDIVLVDQRGTGKSNPLNCRGGGDSLRDLTEPDDGRRSRICGPAWRGCRVTRASTPPTSRWTISTTSAPGSATTGSISMAARTAPGPPWSTCAATARTCARSCWTAWRRWTCACRCTPRATRSARSTSCTRTACATTPAAAPTRSCLERTRALFARLDARPARVKVAHPRTGVVEEIEITSKLVASIVFKALYSPLTASILPSLIERAEHDDFQGLLALAFAGESSTDMMSLGMQLSVLCSEDSPRYVEEDITREAAGTLFGTRLLTGQVAACRFWPKGRVDDAYYAPVASPLPALVLSGELDPVTPPTWGLEVVKHLPNGRHVVMPGTGHGVAATACGNRLVTEFIEKGDAHDLDAGCVRGVQRPGFFLTPAGPEPAPLALASSGAGDRR